MAWDGYFEYDGVEIINASRAEAYARALNLHWVKETGAAPDLAVLLGEEYSSPTLDPAPWHDPYDADANGFAGIIPLDVNGLEDSTRSATTFEYTTDGGSAGRIRHATREATFRVALVGVDSCAVEYGFRWLKRALLNRSCTPGVEQSCVGADLVFSRCFPSQVQGTPSDAYDAGGAAEPLPELELDAVDDAETFIDGGGTGSQAQPLWDDDFRRYVRNVTFTRGPIVTGKRDIPGCPGTVWIVSFTATIGDPFQYGSATAILRGLGGEGNPYVDDPNLGLDDEIIYEWVGTENASASTKTVNGALAETNYCVDPSGEAAVLFSPQGSSDTPVQDITHVRTGTYATKLNRGAGANDIAGTRALAGEMPARTAGHKITVSFWMWVPSGFAGDHGISMAGAGIVESSGSILVTTAVRDQWARVQTTGTDTGSGGFSLQVRAGDTAHDIWVDDVMITYGPPGTPHGDWFWGNSPDVVPLAPWGETSYVAADCPVPVYTPIFDPLFPALVAPPTPPALVPGGFEKPEGVWTRHYAEIPARVIPTWDEVRPIITLRASGADARMIRVRLYPALASPADNCGQVGEFIITYLPEGWDFVIDTAEKAVYVQNGTMQRRAESLVFGSTQADPIRWFGLSCGEKYLVTLDWDSTTTPDVEMDFDLVPRSA